MRLTVKIRYPFNQLLEKKEIILESPRDEVCLPEIFDQLKQKLPAFYQLLALNNMLDDSGYPNALTVVDGIVAGLDTKIKDQAELILFYRADGG